MRRTPMSLICAAALLLGATACGDDGEDGESADAASTTSQEEDPSAALSMPPGDAAIQPGTYEIPRSGWSNVDFTVTFPEGWVTQYGHLYIKHQDEADELGFYAVAVDEIFTDACHGEGEPMEVGPGVDGLVAALRAQPGPEVSEPVEATLGGQPATRVDLTVPEDLDLETCRLFEDGVHGLQVWYSRPADKYFVLLPDATASAYILEVGGKRQVFLTQVSAAASDEDRAELQAVLDSIRIEA